MIKTLVTGGHGFIGHHLVRKLVEQGHDVTVVDNYCDYGTLDAEYMGLVNAERRDHMGKEVRCIDKDVRHFIMDDDYDMVYHLAGFPRQYETGLNMNWAASVAGEGLINVLRQCINTERFVYVSTSMVYGDFEPQTTEEAIPNPKSQYGSMRLMGEYITKSFCESRDIPWTIIRPSAVYGERDNYNRIVGKFFSRLQRGLPLEVRGSAERLDFTHVSDLVDGLARLTNLNAIDQIFNLTYSAQVPYTILDLAKRVCQLFGMDDHYVVHERDQAFPMRSTLNVDKARSLLGYNPSIDLDTGIEKVYEWTQSSLAMRAFATTA